MACLCLGDALVYIYVCRFALFYFNQLINQSINQSDERSTYIDLAAHFSIELEPIGDSITVSTIVIRW